MVRHTASPLSFSIKGRNKKKEDTVVDKSENKSYEKLEEAYTELDLIKAWKLFAEKQTEDDHLKNTLLNFTPKLQSNDLAVVAVSNPSQEDKLKSVIPDLYSHLYSQLKNTNIRLEIRMLETTEEKRPFTPQEKYKFMVEKNPNLKTLVDELKLRLD